MAREPELSIKVKVDPQIKPTELKTSIERKVKQSGEKPQIDIDPNVDGIKKKVEDKLKNIKATANITPIIDTEKLKTDIQQQINGIGNIPKVTIGVNVDDFSSELTKQLKDQLKEVNQQLSYYLKNLTSNTDRLGSFANDIFPMKELKTSAKQVANEVSDEFTGGLSKTFNINDLLNFKVSDSTKRKDLSQVEGLVKEIRNIWNGLYADNWTDDDKINLNAFNDQFGQLGIKAKELKSILDSVYSAFDSDKFNDKLNVFKAQGFPLDKKLQEFLSIDDFLDEIINKSKTKFKTTDQAIGFSNLLDSLTGDNKLKFDSILSFVSDELGNVQIKIKQINSSAKAVKTEIKDVQKEANVAQKTDTSGHLDASTIETYGQKLDEVLKNIADKQNAINNARRTAVDLEKSILAATVLTREGLSSELAQYEALFKKFDTDKIAKFAETTNLAEFIKNQEVKMQAAQGNGEKNQIEDGVYNVKDVKFNIDPTVLQLKVDEAFKDISAPIDLHLKKDAAKHVKDELGTSLNTYNIPDVPKNSDQNNVSSTVPVPGKVTITDADVIVDVKTPVSIPGTVTVDPTAVQFGNFDDLQKNADALFSVKQSLKGIFTSAEGYGTKIAAIGPSVQYVAQEVDSLSKSIENQITDLDLITKKTDAYGTTANSIILNTKDVMVAGDSVNVPVKATLEKTAITVPKEAVDIKVTGVLAPEAVKQAETVAPQKPTEVPGRVILSADDVVAPTAPVDIPGKVTLKVEDVKPPKGSVKIPGKVELEVSDITPPKTAIELEGKVSNVTVDDTAKSKKKNSKDDVKKPDVIDFKGKVELKDEDIKRPNPLNLNGAVKIKAADVKIDDVEISKKEFDIKGNLILKNAENIAKSTTGSESSVSGISTVIDHPTVETDNFEARLAALDNLDHQSKEYKDGLEEIIADWKLTNKEIDEAISNEKKLNSAQEDRSASLQKIKDAIEANSKNMNRARKNGTAGKDLLSQFAAKEKVYKALEAEVSSGNGVKGWAQTYFPEKVEEINNVADALREMRGELTQSKIDLAELSTGKSIERSSNKAAMEVANLKSQIHDYLDINKKIQNSELAQPFRDLMNALNSENAPEKISKLKKQFAELRAKSKELGLETESLIDKFEKLFGTHLSTMITMAALHKMQDALRIVYQNVVEIDTAMTELRKVTNLTASGYEEFMDRAADQAQKLGVSINDFINSTADWARLGYDEQDAEELARVSSLLKNVGDGIESASDASSYLISGMKGFDLAADQASKFLDVLNQIANTEPVTANDLGVIIQKSAAAMNAAGNTYQETMAMAAAVNGVLQDNDVSGTYLKTLSMYLRAAKTDAENAGIEIDGMASSVSELRNELKQLTGVDIMSDAAGKNFKSTYQIMEELSKVWGSLSDVTQANVTELISGKRGGQATSALLNNFSVAEDAMKQAANATGSALAENAKYLDSIQGRIAKLDTSFQSLSTHVLDSGIVKYAVSFLTTIIKITDNITKLSGVLPPIAAAVSGILSVMQMNGKLENGAGKVNMPAYACCA